jgi:chromosome segregation ATPase
MITERDALISERDERIAQLESNNPLNEKLQKAVQLIKRLNSENAQLKAKPAQEGSGFEEVNNETLNNLMSEVSMLQEKLTAAENDLQSNLVDAERLAQIDGAYNDLLMQNEEMNHLCSMLQEKVSIQQKEIEMLQLVKSEASEPNEMSELKEQLNIKTEAVARLETFIETHYEKQKTQYQDRIRELESQTSKIDDKKNDSLEKLLAAKEDEISSMKGEYESKVDGLNTQLQRIKAMAAEKIKKLMSEKEPLAAKFKDSKSNNTNETRKTSDAASSPTRQAEIAQIKALQSALKEKEHIIIDLNQKLGNSVAEYYSAREQCLSAVDYKKTSTTDHNQKLKAAKDEQSTMSGLYDILKAENDDSNTEIESLKQQLTSSRNTAVDYEKTSTSDHNQKLKAAKEKQSTMSGKYDLLKAENDDSNTEIESLKKQLTHSRNLLSPDYAAAEGHMLTLNTKISSLESKLQSMNERYHEAKDQLERVPLLTERISVLEEEKEKLERWASGEHCREIDELKSKLSSVTNQLESLKKQHSSELRTAKLQYESLPEEIAVLRSMAEDATLGESHGVSTADKEIVSSLQQEVEQLNFELEMNAQTISELNTQILSLQKSNAGLESSLAEYSAVAQRDIEQVTHSLKDQYTLELEQSSLKLRENDAQIKNLQDEIIAAGNKLQMLDTELMGAKAQLTDALEATKAKLAEREESLSDTAIISAALLQILEPNASLDAAFENLNTSIAEPLKGISEYILRIKSENHNAKQQVDQLERNTGIPLI